MPLDSLLEPPVLFLDAASPIVCVGWWSTAGSQIEWRETDDEAGVGLFRSTEELVRASGSTLRDVGAAVFCDGPGSLLGIRLSAMALRTWRALPRSQPLRTFGYHSLALVAAERLVAGVSPPFHVCSDARRETWNVLSVARDGAIGPVRRCPGRELLQIGGTLFHPETFPHWQPLPDFVVPVAYLPERLLGLAAMFPLLHATEAPDAFMAEMPTYRTWSPP